MGVFSPPTSTRLTLKWLSLAVALLLLLQWSIPSVDAHKYNMYGEEVQQQERSCDPQRLSMCRDYLERRREQPSERCCEEVQRLSPQCRCRAIQQILDQTSSPLDQRQRQRRREGRGREEEEEEMEERAADLPNTCNVRQSPRRCEVQRHSRKSFHLLSDATNY